MTEDNDRKLQRCWKVFVMVFSHVRYYEVKSELVQSRRKSSIIMHFGFNFFCIIFIFGLELWKETQSSIMPGMLIRTVQKWVKSKFNKISRIHFINCWKANSAFLKYCCGGFIWIVTPQDFVYRLKCYMYNLFIRLHYSFWEQKHC